MPFPSLGLSDALSQHLAQLGYQTPTLIQQQAIPHVLDNKDIIGIAQTGSGKTAAFGLPLLQRAQQPKSSRGRTNVTPTLILAPTRELASQIAESLKSFAFGLPEPLKIKAVYGGVSINPQMLALRGGCDLLIATPGRLLDLINQNAISLSQTTQLVLDEADKMLALGFSEELEAIKALLPKKRQTLLFSATFSKDTEQLAQQWLCSPVWLEVTSEASVSEQIHQRAIEIDPANRNQALQQLIEHHQWRQVLIFAASKRSANNLATKLHRAGYDVDTLHGDMSQGARQASLRDFKLGTLRILIATDLAARGLDVDALPCVVNYDLPRSPADYVHRIGRTGRQQNQGVALTFIGADDDAHFALIEKKMGQKVTREQLDGFSRQQAAQPKPKGPQPVKGKRKSKKDKLREAAAKDGRTK
ncbi:DEAD/DEAH box helicase [Ferrimonas aestuarii]|uniref:DEAD/DEAH box helicase n=1 Tax=Ferrimonas aestuarii TaxID=2569539 RepID=A0A4U1BQL7_9GAMM|nr:DEAD/DEAH box helicase [Ferrimonas aestuarii]TKB57351.1 DEAD/DEAH box helicase [Ferrimonas aestuarii]